ncbi:MAG: orotidine-5'-phosphate decarboxylase [bacterium]
MNFLERFLHITKKQNSLLCVGLDPDIHRIPKIVTFDPEPLFKFCAEIITSTKHAAAAFKLNFAFFEAEGSKGWSVLEKLVELIPTTTLKIADAKRGDIGSSSEMYAAAILERLGFDAVTVNPYLGRDSIEPFLHWPEKGAFILCLTSNPGSKDFQYFSDGSKTLFTKVLEQAKIWNNRQNCGLVVGATHPKELQTLREVAPNLPFLIPGLGVQGGDLKAAVMHGTDEFGQMALFNTSRSIIYKSCGSDFAEAAQREAELLRDKINKIRKSKMSNKYGSRRNFRNF